MKHITWIFIIIALGGMLEFCLVGALHPLICKVVTWDHPDGRVVRCVKVGSDVRNNGQPEQPTATEYEWPTLTPTDWEPLPYATLTPTERPYPIETVTQEAYS